MTLPLILGIDPGPVTSGVVLYDPVQGVPLASWAKMPTAELLQVVRDGEIHTPQDAWDICGAHLAMEVIIAMGKKIGRETIMTIEAVGRIKEAWSRTDEDATYIDRPNILKHLSGHSTIGEADAKVYLRERHGGLVEAEGTKASPGPLYGLKSHAWSALAVAVVASDTLRKAQA